MCFFYRRYNGHYDVFPDIDEGSLINRRRQFFGTTNKTMKQLLNDGDTTHGGTLYKFVTNIDLLTKL